MPLRDKLRRKENEPPPVTIGGDKDTSPPSSVTIMRSDTYTQEIINAPSFHSHLSSARDISEKPANLRGPASRLRSSSNASSVSTDSRKERRLSSLFHRRSSSRDSRLSTHVPSDLPQIDGSLLNEDSEAQWEKRATLLAQGALPTTHLQQGGDLSRHGYNSPLPQLQRLPEGKQGRTANFTEDDDLQEAIRLHESGDLEKSTTLFGQLADPQGHNNALAQVLFGLALRHGWGIAPDTSLAVNYLSMAAANSASIESQALASGIKKGGTAKGELVIAIYELANCYRHGWGMEEKDLVAARGFYETAANLGDTDAMNEVARCYEEGLGGKKDKFMAAKYYRLAEKHGNKVVGNSWIWKEKYNPKLN